MIGTTFKLGFDGTAVSRGLSGLGGVLGRFGRQIGIGAARKIGYGLTDMIGRLIMSVPLATKELLDWGGEMTDLSAQTKMTTDDLMVMQEALRMAGFKGNATNAIVQLKKNLYDASQGAEEAQWALNQIGIGGSDLLGMPVMDSLKIIGREMSKLAENDPRMEKIQMALFGGRAGKEFLKFFADFDGNMNIAKKNVGDFAKRSKDLLPIYDAISDNLGRWDMVKKDLTSSMLEGLLGMDGLQSAASAVDRMMDSIRDMGGPMRELGQALREIFMVFKELIDKHGIMGALMETMSAAGSAFGDALAESIRDAMNPMSGMFGGGKKKPKAPDTRSMSERLRGFYGLPAAKGGDKTTTLINETKKQTVYLERILRETPTAIFA